MSHHRNHASIVAVHNKIDKLFAIYVLIRIVLDDAIGV